MLPTFTFVYPPRVTTFHFAATQRGSIAWRGMAEGRGGAGPPGSRRSEASAVANPPVQTAILVLYRRTQNTVLPPAHKTEPPVPWQRSAHVSVPLLWAAACYNVLPSLLLCLLLIQGSKACMSERASGVCSQWRHPVCLWTSEMPNLCFQRRLQQCSRSGGLSVVEWQYRTKHSRSP